MPSAVYLPPYKAVQLLPDSVSEQQKDSIIQAHLAPRPVGYNQRVDTLTTFGLKATSHKSIGEMSFIDESYFAHSKYFHPELGTDHRGVAGDPMPYSPASDDLITGLIVGGFLLFMLALSSNLRFFAEQLRNFFYVPKGPTTDASPTYETRFQLFMVALTSLLLAILYYFYANTDTSSSFLLPGGLMLGVYVAIFLGYYALKFLLYGVVNTTFFGSKKNLQHIHSFLFLTSLAGALLFPLVLLVVYFGVTVQTATVYIAVLFVFVKLLQAYKSYIIFFKSFGGILQLFLYFCTLEVMPVLMLLGAIELTGMYLKVNF